MNYKIKSDQKYLKMSQNNNKYEEGILVCKFSPKGFHVRYGELDENTFWFRDVKSIKMLSPMCLEILLNCPSLDRNEEEDLERDNLEEDNLQSFLYHVSPRGEFYKMLDDKWFLYKNKKFERREIIAKLKNRILELETELLNIKRNNFLF